MANNTNQITIDNVTYDLEAQKLSTARKIDGVSFDGSSDIAHYATSSGGSSITCSDVIGFNWTNGSKLAVLLSADATATGASALQLSVSGTSGGTKTSKNIYYRGGPLLSLRSGTYEFVYDGTQFQLIGSIDNTEYVFDGTYNPSTNKAATVSTVTNAINALDVSQVAVGKTKTLSTIKEEDGKIVLGTPVDIGIAASQIDSGTLSVERGGTGAGSLTAGRVLVSNASSATGAITVSDVTTTELGYLDGATSNIQDQIDAITSGGTDNVRFIKLSLATTGTSSNFTIGSNNDNIYGAYNVSVGDFVIGNNGQVGKVTSITAGIATYTRLGVISSKPKATLNGTNLTLNNFEFALTSV